MENQEDCSAVSGDRYGKSVRLRRDAVASGISVGSFYGLCKDGISDNREEMENSAKNEEWPYVRMPFNR